MAIEAKELTKLRQKLQCYPLNFEDFKVIWPAHSCGRKGAERMPSSEEIAWFAGFFDGEGSITISKNPSLRRSRRTPLYRLCIVVSNTDPRTIHKIRQIWGVGSINFQPYTRKHKNNKPIWRWQATCNQAARILWFSYSYLISKKSEAEIAILFQYRKAYRNKTWNNRFTPDSVFLEDGKFKDLLSQTRLARYEVN